MQQICNLSINIFENSKPENTAVAVVLAVKDVSLIGKHISNVRTLYRVVQGG